jgi:hypothetical protein
MVKLADHHLDGFDGCDLTGLAYQLNSEAARLEKPKVDDTELRAAYITAMGLLSTLAPQMEINVNDPMTMASEIHRVVCGMATALAQSEARAERYEKALREIEHHLRTEPASDILCGAMALLARAALAADPPKSNESNQSHGG